MVRLRQLAAVADNTTQLADVLKFGLDHLLQSEERYRFIVSSSIDFVYCTYACSYTIIVLYYG